MVIAVSMGAVAVAFLLWRFASKMQKTARHWEESQRRAEEHQREIARNAIRGN